MKRIVVPQLFGRSHLFNSISNLSIGLVTAVASGSVVQAADIRPVTNPVGTNSYISTGASHLSSGQFRLGIEANAARRVSLKQVKSADDHIFLSETGAASMAAGFGISDKLSLHLNAEMTRHIQKNTDPEVTARESKKSKFSGATLASQYVFTDRMGWFHSGLSLYGKSSGEKNGKFSYVRDQNPVYGIILGQSFGDLTGSHVSLDIGAQFKNASTDEVLRETHRYHSSLTAYVGLFDSLSLFTGLSGQEINSKEPNKKIYSASYHYGLEWNYSGLEVSAYGSYGLKSASYGTGRQEGGLAISYTFGSVSNVSSESKTKAEAHTEKSKASKPAKKEQVEEEEQISIEKIVEQLPKSKNPEEMDEFELQELRQKEEQKKFGNGLTEWEKIEQELEQIKATEKLQKEADERRQKEQERVDRANRVKNTKEEERRLKVLQEEVADEVNSLEGVSDDELNWRGLD